MRSLSFLEGAPIMDNYTLYANGTLSLSVRSELKRLTVTSDRGISNIVLSIGRPGSNVMTDYILYKNTSTSMLSSVDISLQEGYYESFGDQSKVPFSSFPEGEYTLSLKVTSSSLSTTYTDITLYYDNSPINKVIFDGIALIDLSSDTVVPEKLEVGYTAHNAAGEPIVGTKEASAKTSFGEITLSTSEATTITLGWKPKKLAYMTVPSTETSSAGAIGIYDEDYSTTYFRNGYRSGSTSTVQRQALESNVVGALNSINSTGFTINKTNATYGSKTLYFAIG